MVMAREYSWVVPSAMGETGFLIPAALHRAELSIDRSRFIASVGHAGSAAAARAFIDAVRAEFPDATHNCWAFVAGPPGDTASIGMSDAGEPHGTAGRPMLDVLIHSGIGEVVAVVTRYYGGIKLGTGGLVKAYGGCVQHALATLPTIRKVERVHVVIEAEYADVDTLRRALGEFDAELLAENYGERVRYETAVPRAAVDRFTRTLVNRTAGRASFLIDGL
jgi:uncharacterized YigZ family protein